MTIEDVDNLDMLSIAKRMWAGQELKEATEGFTTTQEINEYNSKVKEYVKFFNNMSSGLSMHASNNAYAYHEEISWRLRGYKGFKVNKLQTLPQLAATDPTNPNGKHTKQWL